MSRFRNIRGAHGETVCGPFGASVREMFHVQMRADPELMARSLPCGSYGLQHNRQDGRPPCWRPGPRDRRWGRGRMATRGHPGGGGGR